MTSAELIDELAGNKSVGDVKVEISESEVLYAASFAQNDILTKLKLVEQTFQLALAKGQESYSFSPKIPTAISTALNGEAILTVVRHPYHTGDEVVAYKIAAGVDGRRIVTVLDADKVQLIGSANAPATVGAGAMLYHGLQAAIKIVDDGIRKISNTSGPLFGTLIKKSRTQFELYREEFGTAVAPESLINFYEEYTVPCLTVHVQGPPGSDVLVKVTVKRRPLPSEKLTRTIDPFIPPEYDELFLYGTKWVLYNNREETAFQGLAKKWGDLYYGKLKEANAVVSGSRVVYNNAGEGISFG